MKTTILAVLALLSIATESQARPQIWNFLGGVVVGSALTNSHACGPTYYYTEPPRYYYQEHPVVYYPQPRYYYREPQVVYYGRPVYGRCR